MTDSLVQFQSSKHPLFTFLLLIFPVCSLFYLLVVATKIFPDLYLTETIVIVSFLFAFLILWLMLHAYQNTIYIISDDQLSYKMGILKGTIPIHKIWLIKASTYPTSGNRPALDWNGLKIIYGADHALFVSPASQDDFIALLKQKNTAIEVML